MFELAAQDAERTALRASLGRVGASVETKELRLLRDPGVSLARRRAAARALTESEPATVRSLVALLIEGDRVALLPGISIAFDELMDRQAGIAKARVTTAVELDTSQRRDVAARLGRATGKTIQATFDVDPSLLAGARIQVGDRLLDASVRSELDRLRDAMSTGR